MRSGSPSIGEVRVPRGFRGLVRPASHCGAEPKKYWESRARAAEGTRLGPPGQGPLGTAAAS